MNGLSLSNQASCSERLLIVVEVIWEVVCSCWQETVMPVNCSNHGRSSRLKVAALRFEIESHRDASVHIAKSRESTSNWSRQLPQPHREDKVRNEVGFGNFQGVHIINS